MKKFTLSTIGLVLASFLSIMSAKADHLSDRLTFSARLQPAPGIITLGNGVAAFMLNSSRDTMYFTTSFAKLSSPMVGFHIHNGRTGGNVIIDFDGKVEGNTVRSFITGTQLSGILTDFIEGNLYVAVHTVTNPAVEILGSIKLESDWGFAASLDGPQDGSSSIATGHAAINFGMKGDTAIIRVVTNMSNKITGAHLHNGKAGQNGGVILSLGGLISSDSVTLSGGISMNAATWTKVLACLMADSCYINLHTSAFPGGEIRGQVRTTKTLRFDASMTPAAVTAGGGILSKASSAVGVSTLWLNQTMDTLRYNVYFKGLTSNAGAMHFHNGEANASGSVVKPIAFTGNTVTAIWTKYDATAPLTNTIINQLIGGSLYINLHTDSNPGGEIRGQVYRLAREGFIAEINGKQSGTLSRTQGSAIVSYDRDRTNLHYMISTDNLTSPFASAHFHTGLKGQSGPVVYDLGTPVDNGFYNYWTNAAGFNNTQSIALRRNDSMYINIHSSTFPGGEIRGQLWRNYKISSPSLTPPPPQEPDYLSDRLTFSAKLIPAPTVTTTANGVGAFMLNSTHDTLYFTISYAKLSTALTGFHIHNGRTGGNVIIDFNGKTDKNTVRSFITGTQLTGLMTDLIEGNLYVAVHTTANPAVEILGNIKLETDWGFSAILDGTQATTISPATGLASINFSMKGDLAEVRLVSNLNNKITSAHLHNGKAGQSGGVILNLGNLILMDSSTLSGKVQMNAATWTNVLACLMSDSVYINLHTSAYPGGEIRGQVRSTKTLRFDSWMSQKGISEGGGTPAQISGATGVSTLWLNNTMDTLKYNIMITGLSSSATSAHFHNGNVMMNGPVVKSLTLTGNTISGLWTKTDSEPFSNAMVSELLKGNLYLNVHTTNNPNGELRGQVYRLAREGFIAELNNAQAATTGTAQGTVIASYDRERTNLHTMLAFDGLQGTVTSGHIHGGRKGQSGPVLIALDPFTNNGSYTYAKAAEGFTEMNSISMRRNDSTYVNIHTSTSANGEIRGQLMRYYRISSPSISTGVNEELLKSGTAISMYPNPVEDAFTVGFETKNTVNATLNIYDLNGRLVMKSDVQSISGITINTSQLNSGIYIAELLLNEQVATRSKLLKN